MVKKNSCNAKGPNGLNLGQLQLRGAWLVPIMVKGSYNFAVQKSCQT